MTYYVDNSGAEGKAFKTINEAAKVAVAGDEVVVKDGVYREWVDPKNGGSAEGRIVYRAEHPGRAIITGAEEVKGWQKVKGSEVWTVRLSNSMFKGIRNPYTTLVQGDWFIESFIAHTGEVYLNGKSLYEVASIDAVKNPATYLPSWDREYTKSVWYTEQDEKTDETVLYASFQGSDPNKECVEVNVRPACFYPSKEGVGYITLSGFIIKQAASQWAPPTAYQEGMIGPHWSKGWIIEDCEVSHSKCSGISLGKYLQKDNENKWSNWKYKDGTQTQRDCVCQAQNDGYSKDTIGSHIIRRCHIHDCGQTGIVGHLGGAFSIIEDCHIHNINNKQNLAGAEIGGIKMHGAIDVIYRRCHIHHCTRGLWLDWQAQGTRVTECFFHDNTLPNDYNLNKEGAVGLGEDIFVEVSHGPTLIDNNILLSDCALRLCAQGIAIVNNFIAGSLVAVGRGVDNGSVKLPSPRYTPYHLPHKTQVAGFMTILHGDIRFYNNVFVQKPIREGMQLLSDAMKDNSWADLNITAGSAPYDEYPTESEWKAMFEGYCGMGSAPSDRYYAHLPVWMGGNAYFNGAMPCKKEKDLYVDTKNTVTIEIEGGKEGEEDVLNTNAYSLLPKELFKEVSTNTLGIAFESEERFETPDGKEITFEKGLSSMFLHK